MIHDTFKNMLLITRDIMSLLLTTSVCPHSASASQNEGLKPSRDVRCLLRIVSNKAAVGSYSLHPWEPHYCPLPLPRCGSFPDLPQPGLGVPPPHPKNSQSTYGLLLQHSQRVCVVMAGVVSGILVPLPGTVRGAHRVFAERRNPTLKRAALSGGLSRVPLKERSW